MAFYRIVFIILFCFTAFSNAIAQTGSITSGPEEIIHILEEGGVFQAPEFEFTSAYDAYKTYDHLQGLFFDALPYHGDSTKVFCWYGFPENIPEGTTVPAVLLVHGGGGTVFPEWVKKWNDRGYAAISIALEGQVAGVKDDENKWPRHAYSGPSRTGFFSDLDMENTEDVWFFHAVADVILANSLIRSFAEIDTTRIGITGISWGGILSPVIAGVDRRLDFVIPVYGCGYLQDSPLYHRLLGNLSSAAQEEYLRSWDPSNYIPRISAPVLFVNGTNDCHFTMNCFTRSYEALNAEKYLRVEHNMPHGHAPGWTPGAIYQFADYITGDGPRPITFTFESLANQQRLNYSYLGDLESASIFYTIDTADWDCENYEWIEKPAELDTANRKVTSRIPEDAKYYFVNGVSTNGTLFSSSMRKVEPDNTFEAYPEFSWDHVPLYMHMRKSEAFDQAELEYLAGFPILTLEKTTGSTTYGSSETGAVEAASGIKSIHPETKVLFYWNAMINYHSYDAGAKVDTIPGAFLEDDSGNTLLHAGVREVYDLSNPGVVEWWLDQCIEMTGKEEIDGVFVDANIKAVTPSYLGSVVGEEKKQAVLDGYNTMMAEMNLRMNPSKLKIGNMIRASLPDAGLEYMHYFDGSYLENFEGDPDYVAKGIAAFQSAAREGKIITLCMNGGEAIPETIDEDQNGHLITDSAFQARLDYCLSIFLVCAEEYSYFLLHDGYNVNPGISKLWMTRFAEYDKPLGPPKGPAEKSGYIYTRQFENAAVYLNLATGEGKINWDSDSIPYPQVPSLPKKYSLEFIIDEVNAPSYVTGALIEIDSLSAFTNATGQQVFSLDSGMYQYTVSKNGFFSLDSTIYLISDSTVHIHLQSKTASVKFRIKEEDSPIIAANIIVNGNILQSNAVGIAVFPDLEVFENYQWTVSKDNYESDSGSFYLVADTTITVLMDTLDSSDPNGVFAYRKNQLILYPMPVNDYFLLETEADMQAIKIWDFTGRLLLSKCVSGRTARIVLAERIPNFCVLNVFFENNMVITKRIMHFNSP